MMAPDPIPVTFERVLEDVVRSINPVLRTRHLDPIERHVKRELLPQEQAAFLSVYQLAGVEAARRWLDERFAEPGDDLANGKGLFIPFRFVRLRPGTPRQVHVMARFGVTFTKEPGWHRVSKALAAACAQELENEGNPDTSPALFDVSTEPPVGARVVELDR